MSKTTPAPAAPVFELDGGALCLDFANSWGNQADPGSDRLRDYGHLLAFARETGLLDEAALGSLTRAAGEQPEESARVLQEAKELRQLLYRIFAAKARGQEIDDADLQTLNGALGEALARRELCCRDAAVRWAWRQAEEGEFRAPLWPILESAASLLTCDDLGRIRECDAGDCNWLFLDRSRNRSRRWCSMESCGNRAKVRRHYRRHKGD